MPSRLSGLEEKTTDAATRPTSAIRAKQLMSRFACRNRAETKAIRAARRTATAMGMMGAKSMMSTVKGMAGAGIGVLREYTTIIGAIAMMPKSTLSP